MGGFDQEGMLEHFGGMWAMSSFLSFCYRGGHFIIIHCILQVCVVHFYLCVIDYCFFFQIKKEKGLFGRVGHLLG